jgi:hypothetical protein
MKNILTTQLKEALGSLGYTDIRDLQSNAFGVIVPKTRVPLVVPQLAKLLASYQPKRISDIELRIGDKTVFAKNANMQRSRQGFTGGRANEWNLIEAIQSYREDYGKPIVVEFKGNGRKFVCKDVMKVDHVGAKDIFRRFKADVHLVTSKMMVYPISVKDKNAGAWESADTYWAEKAQAFVNWAVHKKFTLLESNDAGGFRLNPPIAIAATDREIRDVVFGTDLYGKGAVIVESFGASSFRWDYARDVLVVECQDIILNETHVRGDHSVFFNVRNDKTRNSKKLHRGLRTVAAMKNHLQGVKVFERGIRGQVGI